ncbi:MAG: hypothetical protein A2452_02830 [Candidatus Firestonebacteria bacterium RIFOXYC2_FULL_39_67]|nr:MAG: hypothetical protein A2536_02245 [Candidatus Firestonebacteria bacterium RIFOXYD2_FULL_39_29]OGF55392.1 MAG: hypothetical protein A2452_02830 [Candidatus Firestonebacteria bacterium RIFOXYC2_FULL_39_67]OGF56111.1 MAG: hypothetical protein A2497_00570 [Candidatus Firestonebacteria bacterium RifOxyC12_full_39_7]
MFYKYLAIIVGAASAATGFYFIDKARGYFIESFVDYFLYFMHSFASIFIFVVGIVTALITLSETLEKKKR